MRYNDVIYLIRTGVTTSDELGNPIKSDTKHLRYVNKMAVSSSEFYQASVSGLKPEQQFEINTYEYSGERSLEYDGELFTIIRTQGKGERTRLICQPKIGRSGGVIIG